jgi:acyl carrier protein
MGNIKDVEKEVKEIIAQILEVEPEKITPEAKFVEDLGMDSMMALEIVAAIEKKYKVVIPEEHLMKLANLNDVINMTQQFLGKK